MGAYPSKVEVKSDPMRSFGPLFIEVRGGFVIGGGLPAEPEPALGTAFGGERLDEGAPGPSPALAGPARVRGRLLTQS